MVEIRFQGSTTDNVIRQIIAFAEKCKEGGNQRVKGTEGKTPAERDRNVRHG